MGEPVWPGSQIMDTILDTAHPPVARFRLMSMGISPNHMLQVGPEIVGQQACIACGNCLDACPVVATKPRESVVARTSMMLENIVGRECRRCYKCVASCPQVSRPVKDYVRGHRRVERGSHWMIATSVVALALSGISMYHYRQELPDFYVLMLGMVHRAFAITLVAGVLLFLVGDARHFARAIRNTFTWSSEDTTWFRDFWTWLTSLGRQGKLMRGDFNSAQKLWYGFMAAAITLFVVTGALRWAGPAVISEPLSQVNTLVHVNLALLSDILVAFHVFLKIVVPNARDVIRGIAHTLAVRAQRSAQPGQDLAPEVEKIGGGEIGLLAGH